MIRKKASWKSSYQELLREKGVSISLFILTLVPWAIRPLTIFVSFNYIWRIAWVRRELMRSPVQPPAHSRATSEVRSQVVQGFVQLDLESHQVGDCKASLGRLPHWWAVFRETKALPYIQPEHLFSQFMLVVSPACLRPSE